MSSYTAASILVCLEISLPKKEFLVFKFSCRNVLKYNGRMQSQLANLLNDHTIKKK